MRENRLIFERVGKVKLPSPQPEPGGAETEEGRKKELEELDIPFDDEEYLREFRRAMSSG